MSRPKKILFVTESHYLHTGYGRMSKEILSRLHNSGKYDIAELASYGDGNHPAVQSCPWKFFPNNPTTPEENQTYQSQPNFQFGRFRFEETCLAFRPDIVADFRDPWYFDWIRQSPFRDKFHIALCPTVDATPQNEDWIDTFKDADALLTYQDWSLDVLRQHDPTGQLKLHGSAVPGVDPSFVMIPDKRQHRKNCGLDPDLFIIMMTGRNQARKYFANLIRDFAKIVEKLPEHLRAKARLYLHTSHPDVGWDLPKHIKESGVSHKILMTYTCANQQCGNTIVSPFQDARAVCPKCQQLSLVPPSPNFGVTQENLCAIYNLADLYVQYANSGALELPMVEAAACGVPVMGTYYAAMKYNVDVLKGYGIIPGVLQIDTQNGGCMRAIPDANDFINQVLKWVGLPSDMKEKKRRQTAELARKYFDWETCVSVWMRVFDSLPLKDERETWLSPPKIIQPQTQVPNGMMPAQAISWAIDNILCESKYKNSYTEAKLIHQASCDLSPDAAVTKQILEGMHTSRQNANQWEARRAQTFGLMATPSN